MPNIDLLSLTRAEQISGEDAEETELLRKMLQEATEYLRGFRWCPPIDTVYFGCGVGGVVAVFLFHLQRPIEGTDEWLWVIEGDLPAAYLVCDQANDPASALSVYCEMMEDWASAVLGRGAVKEVFPVEAARTAENANSLLKRVSFIRTRLMPEYRCRWPAGGSEPKKRTT